MNTAGNGSKIAPGKAHTGMVNSKCETTMPAMSVPTKEGQTSGKVIHARMKSVTKNETMNSMPD
jgi:hypothetical protein